MILLIREIKYKLEKVKSLIFLTFVFNIANIRYMGHTGHG